MYRTSTFVLSLILGFLFLAANLVNATETNKYKYKIGPSDILNVTIYAGGEVQVAVDLAVSDQGTVNFPFLGTVNTGGQSISQLEKNVSIPLEENYFVDPQVHIQIKEYHSLHFFISGAVKKPGKYEMQSATTIMDLIARAEGATADRGNIAYILREGLQDKNGIVKEPLKVNLLKLLDEGDMSNNLLLVPGDSVYIPLAKGLDQSEMKVYVSGEVKKPDMYEYQPGLTALSICIMAGGFDKYAAPNRTTIVRLEDGSQQVIKINLEDVVEGKIPDIPLKPGDRVNVPETWL